MAGAERDSTNHVWIEELQPGTTYGYRVVVEGDPWRQGPRLDWSPEGLRSASRPTSG